MAKDLVTKSVGQTLTKTNLARFLFVFMSVNGTASVANLHCLVDPCPVSHKNPDLYILRLSFLLGWMLTHCHLRSQDCQLTSIPPPLSPNVYIQGLSFAYIASLVGDYVPSYWGHLCT